MSLSQLNQRRYPTAPTPLVSGVAAAACAALGKALLAAVFPAAALGYLLICLSRIFEMANEEARSKQPAEVPRAGAGDFGKHGLFGRQAGLMSETLLKEER